MQLAFNKLPYAYDALEPHIDSMMGNHRVLGYTFIAYIGIFLEKTHLTNYVLEKLDSIPYATCSG